MNTMTSFAKVSSFNLTAEILLANQETEAKNKEMEQLMKDFGYDWEFDYGEILHESEVDENPLYKNAKVKRLKVSHDDSYYGTFAGVRNVIFANRFDKWEYANLISASQGSNKPQMKIYPGVMFALSVENAGHKVYVVKGFSSQDATSIDVFELDRDNFSNDFHHRVEKALSYQKAWMNGMDQDEIEDLFITNYNFASFSAKL